MKTCDTVLLSLLLVLAGCAAHTDYMVSYRSVAPFDPADPNELRRELTGNLPAAMAIRHFVYHRRDHEMRGIVVVRGGRARDAVHEAIRSNPRLAETGVGPQEVHAVGKSLICFCSMPPFQPRDPDTLLAALRQELPPEIKPKIVRSRRHDDGIVLWITVRGNFGKEAVKFALWRNPSFRLLQVENAPIWLGL
jgi:hypothetical protein